MAKTHAKILFGIGLYLGSCEGEVEKTALPTLPPPAVSVEGPREEERPVRELTLAFVGEVRGEIEPCGCPTLPYGGFARRVRALAGISGFGPLFHLDAGERLVKGVVTRSSEERLERARLVVELSREAGVDVWSLGPADLGALGKDDLGALLIADRDGIVGATWEPKEGNGVDPPDARVVERGGIRLGVIGVSSPPKQALDEHVWSAIDPVLAVRRGLKGLSTEVDLVVALGTLDDADAQRIAKEVDGLSMVLATRGRETEDPHNPRRADGRPGALVVEVPERGRYLQVVRLRLGTYAGIPAVQLPSANDWRNLHRLRRAEGGAQQEQRAALEARFAEEGRGRNLAWAELIPLAEDLDRAPADLGEVDSGEAALLARLSNYRQERLSAAGEAAAQEPEEGSQQYAGGGACATCHAAEVARWALTGHARAFLSLAKQKENTENPECVRCHSTGWGEPGGLGTLSGPDLGRLKNVQCESCHGPMGGHPQRPVTPMPVRKETCLRCHDPANSPEFVFEPYLNRASCQGGAPVRLPAGTLPEGHPQ